MKTAKRIPGRLLAQFAFFVLQNPFLANFHKGRIYQGRLKLACTPGLNCYSCPAAVASCPIGSLQMFLGGARHSMSLYVTGFLLTLGVVFGRFICGYVCPMGLLQDLLYKIKAPKIKLRLRYARYAKYAVLVLFVIVLPFVVRDELIRTGAPWFCKYICPSGTIFAAAPLLGANDFLRAMVGAQFYIKAAIAFGLMLTSIFVFRFFCRVLCPLGAVYALFNKFAFLRMHCHKDKCTSCGKCRQACHIMLEPDKNPNSPECVRCGKCVKACDVRALRYRP